MPTYARMDGKICLVTGATSGIGKVTAQTLAALGAEVILVGRNPAKAQAAVRELHETHPGARVHVLLADFADLEQVRDLARRVREGFPRLDVLINNAGAVFLTRQGTRYGVEKTFLVNHLAPFLLTNLLLEMLLAASSARVINVASEAHRSASLNLDDLSDRQGYSALKAYARSKLANILFTVELARRLQGTRVTVNAVHPGVVATGIWRIGFPFLDQLIQWAVRPFMLSPEEGADTLLYLATDPGVEGITGQYFIKRRTVRPAPQATDPDLAHRLWEVSAMLVGLAPDSAHSPPPGKMHKTAAP